MQHIRRVESRLAETVSEYIGTVKTPDEAYQILRPLLEDKPVETFAILLLNTNHVVFGYAEVSTGTLTNTLVHPREVFGPAIRMNAAAIILSHNHPSGNPEPSKEDYDVTKRIKEAGQLLGIPVLDHLVIGHDCYQRITV